MARRAFAGAVYRIYSVQRQRQPVWVRHLFDRMDGGGLGHHQDGGQGQPCMVTWHNALVMSHEQCYGVANSPATRPFVQQFVHTNNKESIIDLFKGHWGSPHKVPIMWEAFPCHDVIMKDILGMKTCSLSWSKCIRVVKSRPNLNCNYVLANQPQIIIP